MSDDDRPSAGGVFRASMSFHTGNVAEQWRKFKKQLSYYFDIKFTKKQLTDQKKVGLLMTALGTDGIEILESLFDDDADLPPPTFKQVIEAFDEFCNPKKNTVFERSVYFQMRQKPAQSIDSFIVALKNQAALCEFSYDEKENLIRDILVIGVRDAKLREELLRDPDLDLATAVQAAKIRERSQAEALQMETPHQPEKLAVAKLDERAPSSAAPSNAAARSSERVSSIVPRCGACAFRHGTARPCPALRGTCNTCGKRGHFSRMCPQKPAKKDVKAVTENADDAHPDDEERRADWLRIYRLTDAESNVSAWYVTLQFGETQCRFKLDTAAECNTMSELSCKKLRPKPQLVPSVVVIKPYNAPAFRPLGKIVIPHSSGPLEFQVMPASEENLLGLRTCQKLRLIKRVSRVNCFSSKDAFVAYNADVFQGEGKIPGLVKLYTDPEISPKVARPRRFAYSLNSKLIDTIKKMADQGVIERVTEPTSWVSNLTLVEKPDGSLRLCLDPQNLNKALLVPKYAIPKTDDYVVRLNGMKLFSVLDLKSGFWHQQLDDASSLLTTFNTPIGRYKFKRLCFGISCAPEIFMSEMVRIFGDIEGVSPYFDDLIIATETEQQHEVALQAVLDRARKFNVKFNLSKLQFKQNRVQFLGLIISADGIRPAPKHMRAIAEMPPPADKSAVLRFLGLVKFLARFIPNVSQLTVHLRNLTKKDEPFEWTTEHESEFSFLKSLITAEPVLAYFDINKPVTVQTDASKDGLGAVLLQDNKPVAFASRALTSAEVRYSQIEKELLAIVFAMEKFHEFVYGRKTMVNSDHRPLESILQKDLDKVSARLQRLRLRLLKYNVVVTYVPGSQVVVADALSRAFLSDEVPDLSYQSITVHAAKTLAVSPQKAEWLATETSADPVLSKVKRMVEEDSWPATAHSLEPGVSKFFAQRADLTITDNMIFFKNRLVIPASARHFFLEKLHEGHLGTEKTKRTARETVFWHGMSIEIEEYIRTCEVCQKFARNNAKQPLMPYPIPLYPWQHLATDIANFEQRDYLIVIDKYSNWPEVVQLTSKSASEVVRHMQNLFARHGIPETVTSDNNPFNSAVYLEFAEKWGFQPKFTSPHFPQSNGHAEKSVQTIKLMLKKCREENSSLPYALLQYRNTPLPDTGYSPAQALMGRRLRTKLPVSSTLLQPKTAPPSEIIRSKERSQEVQRYYFNQTATELSPLQPSQPVWVKDDLADTKWQSGTVTQSGPTPRSYIVAKDGNGGTVVRNRKFLRPRAEIRKPVRFQD